MTYTPTDAVPFSLAVQKSQSSESGVLSPNLWRGAPDRDQRNAAPEQCCALADPPITRAAPGSRSLPPNHSYPAAACEMRSGDTPVIPVDARAE